MTRKRALIGCGIAALTFLLILAVGGFLGWRAFCTFGIGSDLSDYRDAIQRMDIGAETKGQLLRDIEAVRMSLDEQNNFSFFQWVEIDDSIQGILADGKIDTSEHKWLRADILRMKRTQEITGD